MSRNYMDHPELFPEMELTDAYYLDHVQDARQAKATRAAKALKSVETESDSAPQEDSCSEKS